MQIPDYYDPVVHDEHRQARWDSFVGKLPECALCRKKLYPGDKFHTTGCMCVCCSCVEQLIENIEILEENIND